MSAKVGVLAENQPATGKARVHVPRDVAEMLVQRMAAERISQRLIRMMPPDSIFPVLKAPIRPGRYIPEKLPPREVPGCYFEEPQSATWRMQHRNVSFLTQTQEIVVSN